MYKAGVNLDNDFGKIRFNMTGHHCQSLFRNVLNELRFKGYPTANVVLTRVKNRYKEWSIMHGSRCIGCIQYDSGTN